MSDSVTKYFEMVEDGRINPVEKGKWIYESPDGGKTVTRRPFGADVSEKEVILHPQREIQELKKRAYTLLTKYDEDVIRMAMKIIDIGE